jgi:hypothetical protein
MRRSLIVAASVVLSSCFLLLGGYVAFRYYLIPHWGVAQHRQDREQGERDAKRDISQGILRCYYLWPEELLEVRKLEEEEYQGVIWQDYGIRLVKPDWEAHSWNYYWAYDWAQLEHGVLLHGDYFWIRARKKAENNLKLKATKTPNGP